MSPARFKMTITSSLTCAPGPRWVTLPRSIEGQPLALLDASESNPDSARAALYEVTEEGWGTLYEARTRSGRVLALAGDAAAAASLAEQRVDAMRASARRG